MYKALFHKIQSSRANLLIIKLNNLLNNIERPSDNELDAIVEKRNRKYYSNKKRAHELTAYYYEYETYEDIQCIFNFSSSNVRTINQNGISVLADTASKFYNIINNHRVTTDTPSLYNYTIYIFGHCCAAGAFAEDKYTIASQLQRKFNTLKTNYVRVVNAANWNDFEGTVRQILSPKYEFTTGHYIIIISSNVERELCESAIEKFQDKSFYAFHDLSNIFQRPHEYGEVLFDNIHMNHRGYTIVSNHIFDIITKIIETKTSTFPEFPLDLLPYMRYLSMLKNKRKHIGGIIGSIVMNCNPFTLGHRHIVIESLKRCEYLYIFILDEERSFVKFDDRISMVKLGLQEFSNISIVPSGKLIISSETMPEYFEKDDMQDVRIDTSYDLNIFSKFIAPALNITKRFAGSEPVCQISRQYNEGMRDTLPTHGIDFVELPRLSINQHIVSASLVRKYIINNEYDKVKELVPITSYEYLQRKQYIMQ